MTASPAPRSQTGLDPDYPVDDRVTRTCFEILFDSCNATLDLELTIRGRRSVTHRATFAPPMIDDATWWSHRNGGLNSACVLLEPYSHLDAVALLLPASAAVALACCTAPPTLVATAVSGRHLGGPSETSSETPGSAFRRVDVAYGAAHW